MRSSLARFDIGLRASVERATGEGRGHDVRASIARVGLARDESATLEIVDQGDHLTRIQTQKRGQVALRRPAARDGEGQDRVRAHLQLVGGERRVADRLRHGRGARQEEAEVVGEGSVLQA